jgi:hypothetical protein
LPAAGGALRRSSPGITGIEFAIPASANSRIKQFMAQDIIALLEEDARWLRHRAASLRACPRADSAALLFRQFSSALGGRLGAMRRVVYPALKALSWKDVRTDVLVSQAKLAHALAALLTKAPGSAAFATDLAVLLAASGRALALEERELLPLLRDELDDAERAMLALDAERYLVGADGKDGFDHRVHADEWLEEARLVLGSLPEYRGGAQAAASA